MQRTRLAPCERAGRGRFVVTLGEEGALAFGVTGIERVAAFAVETIDTTAAGDAFSAGLAVGLAEGRSLSEALRLASATAALTCTRRGAQAALPERSDVEALLSA